LLAGVLDDMTGDLSAFGRLLHGEYGLPLSHWAEKSAWSENDTAQIARALEILIMLPIAEPSPVAGAAPPGPLQTWSLSDQKIAGQDWETSWQYGLLADMDNASKAAGGQMMTPSEPRLFLLKIRYEKGLFGVFAAHMAEYFCDRGAPPDSAGLGSKLAKIPGLANAGGDFLAGLSLMIEKLGFKPFCAYCEDWC
jgi:hypothetical protein